jgi:hypothetical protein
MDKQESVPTPSSANSIIKHIFKFDDDTKSTLMNLSQYTALAIVPVALLQNVSEKIFPEHDDSKGTLELLAEILGQSLTTLVGLFFIHRVITAIPTFSGSAMGDINLFSIIIVFLLTSFIFSGKVEKKFRAVSDRMLDVWDGKSEEKHKGKKAPQKQGSVVSVSQPISRGGMPVHAPSRADYLNSPNAQTSSTQMMPPQQQQQQQQQQQALPTQGREPEQFSNLAPSEPSAYNAGGGGFASF